MSTEIARAKEEWKEKFKVGSRGRVTNDLGMEVDAVYTPEEIENLDYLRDLGFPGQYPFTRGPYPEMSRHRPWRYSIYSGFGSAEDTNARWKMLYNAGQRSFNLAPDLPTHLGIDSDSPLAEGEVGRVGMAVDTVKDLEVLLADLPIESVPFSTNVEALAPVMMALYIAAARKRGVPLEVLSGTISNDPLTTAAAKQTVVFPLKHCVRLSVDLIEYCTRHMPRFYPINIKGVNYREGGASMVQEMGFIFANAMIYIEEMLKRGLAIDEFAPKLSFFCCEGIHIFEEVAKYRASRRLWAKIMKERFGAKDPASMTFRFTAICNPREMQRQLPEANLVRGACGILAAALGGAQGMLHPAYDEAYEIPSEKSHLLALASQQIIAEETNITKTVDPLGGSYYVEYLTDLLEQQIAAKMQEIEEHGGSIKAIEDGVMQKQILDNFFAEEQAIFAGEKVVVGRNKYRVELETTDVELHKPDPRSVERQLQRLQEIKATRDEGAVQEALARVKQAAEDGSNLMPSMIEAAACYATIGEITAALKEVFGEYQEPIVI